MSNAVLARTISICRLITPAASCNSRSCRPAAGFVGLTSTPSGELVQKLQTLSLQFRPEKAHARYIAPGSIKARDQAEHDRIAGADKDNRNLRGCRLGYRCRRGIRGNHSHSTTYKIGSHYLEAIVLTLSPLVIHRDVFTLDVTGFIDSVQESGHVRCVSAW